MKRKIKGILFLLLGVAPAITIAQLPLHIISHLKISSRGIVTPSIFLQITNIIGTKMCMIMKVMPVIILLAHISPVRTECTLVNVHSVIALLSIPAVILLPIITLCAIKLPVVIATTISMRHILGTLEKINVWFVVLTPKVPYCKRSKQL